MTTAAVSKESLSVLMVGNNPTELGTILDRLKEVKGKEFVTAFAFDWKSCLQCLSAFKPVYIIIDDNIGNEELQLSVKSFLARKATRNVPITIIKNSNYEERLINGPLNYILKSNVTGDLLNNALVNSTTYRKAQQYLQEAYKKRKGKLKEILKATF